MGRTASSEGSAGHLSSFLNLRTSSSTSLGLSATLALLHTKIRLGSSLRSVTYCCTYQRIKDAGFLYLNRPSLREIRVIYNKALPKVTIDDDMDAPPEYVQLFIITLAIRIARKYKLPLNDLQVLIAEKDDILNKIMDRNKDDHQILYSTEDVNPFLQHPLSLEGW